MLLEKPISDELRVADDIVPAIVIVRVAVDDPAHLVSDHLKRFDHVGRKALAVAAIEQRSLDGLRDLCMLAEIAVAATALSQRSVDAAAVRGAFAGSAGQVDRTPVRADNAAWDLLHWCELAHDYAASDASGVGVEIADQAAESTCAGIS